MGDHILALNVGSSTVKFALFAATDEPQRRFYGLVDELGGGSRMRAFTDAGVQIDDHNWADVVQSGQAALAQSILAWVAERAGVRGLAAVAHRVAHGGLDYVAPVVATEGVIADLEALCPLAPLHQPYNLAMLKAFAALGPETPQVACFDTAFFHNLPAPARRVPLPNAWANLGVRRYGFHGLSYDFLLGRLRELDPKAARGKVVFAHLGSGASLCGLNDGAPIDTSMGFSPLDGLVMSTRCGALDPGVVLYMLRQGLTPDQVEDVLYRQSGLLALSGVSGDMRTLLAAHSREAEAAVDQFVFRLVREIGALAATLGGLDALVFSAGIGEHAGEIRRRTCERLAWLGVGLDFEANDRDHGKISLSEASTAVWIIAANEEQTLAYAAAQLLR